MQKQCFAWIDRPHPWNGGLISIGRINGYSSNDHYYPTKSECLKDTWTNSLSKNHFLTGIHNVVNFTYYRSPRYTTWEYIICCPSKKIGYENLLNVLQF